MRSRSRLRLGALFLGLGQGRRAAPLPDYLPGGLLERLAARLGGRVPGRWLGLDLGHHGPPVPPRLPNHPDGRVRGEEVLLQPTRQAAIDEPFAVDPMHPAPQLADRLVVRQGLAVRQAVHDVVRVQVSALAVLE